MGGEGRGGGGGGEGERKGEGDGRKKLRYFFCCTNLELSFALFHSSSSPAFKLVFKPYPPPPNTHTTTMSFSACVRACVRAGGGAGDEMSLVHLGINTRNNNVMDINFISRLICCFLSCIPDCKAGFYGLNCSGVCGQCAKGPCDVISGHCSESLCKPGWQGQLCDKGERERERERVNNTVCLCVYVCVCVCGGGGGGYVCVCACVRACG